MGHFMIGKIATEKVKVRDKTVFFGKYFVIINFLGLDQLKVHFKKRYTPLIAAMH